MKKRQGKGGPRPPMAATLVAKSPVEKLEPTQAPKKPKGVKVRQERRRVSGLVHWMSGVFTLIVLVGLGLGAAAIWMGNEVTRAGPLEKPKLVSIRKGDGARQIAEQLQADGIIANHYAFTAHYLASAMHARAFGQTPPQIKAGDYEVAAGASIRDVLRTLKEGRTTLVSVSIPEGWTSHQIVARLRADANLTGEVDVPPEGVMLPDTYRFPRNSSRQAVVDHLIAEREEVLTKAWAERQEGLPFKTPQEAVILASIVERETGKADERAKVAAVFVNRLRSGMRLQSDPTILYGMFGGPVSWGRPIYRVDIQQKTTHNTYQIDGLPPTPISSPSRASIEAVLQPAATRALFFVADGTGGHVFSETLKQHNAAVANWRKIEKEIRARQAAAAQARALAAGQAAAQGAQVAAAPGSSATRAVSRPAPAGAAAAAAAADDDDVVRSAGTGVSGADDAPDAPPAPGAGAVAGGASVPAGPALANGAAAAAVVAVGATGAAASNTGVASDVLPPPPVRKPTRR